jgi:formylglycine-generating enzyme required for sulfatase activity
MAAISGTAQDVAFTQPSAIGGFFGNNSVIFAIAPDIPFPLPGGKNLDLVPVRLDCFIRLPNFDGLKIDVVGDYDDFDGIFRADAIEVKKLGVSLGGAKYFSLWFSIILVFVFLALLVVAVYLGAFISTRNTGYSSFFGAAYFLVLAVVATLALAYIKRVAISVIAERCDRLLRVFTEYRIAASGNPASTITQKSMLQARERRVAKSMAIILGLCLLAVGYDLFLSRYVQEQIDWFSNIRPYVLSVQAEKALQPLAKFQECKSGCPEMIVVPAGNFLMGSPATETGRDDNEGPQHQVTISKPFAVAKFDIRESDWEACVLAEACQVGFRLSDNDYSSGDDKKKSMPMVVKWEEAQQYVKWLSKLTGKPYRLLTESEWEYAARAGSATAYYWGDNIGVGNAVCSSGCGDSDGSPTPVGSFKPNAFGLYDMAGNIWQWAQDCYQENYESAPADGTAWTTGDCNQRLIRGGSFTSLPVDLRSAVRDTTDITNPDDGRAIRVARDLASR